MRNYGWEVGNPVQEDTAFLKSGIRKEAHLFSKSG